MFYFILEHDRVIPVIKSDKIIIRNPAVICIPLIFQIFLILVFKSVIYSIKIAPIASPLLITALSHIQLVSQIWYNIDLDRILIILIGPQTAR